MSENRLNLAIITVFADIRWETAINRYLEGSQGVFWVPFGERSSTLRRVCAYLVSHASWQHQRLAARSGRPTAYDRYRAEGAGGCLRLFHHSSKKQGGSGFIRYRYDVGDVIIADEPIQPLAQLPYEPLQRRSAVWLGIKAFTPISLARAPVDFAGNFEVHPEILDTPRRQVDYKADSAYLYHQVLPVQVFNHKDRADCYCLLCK